MTIEFVRKPSGFRLSVFGLGKLGSDLVEQIQVDYADSDSLTLVTSNVDSEQLRMSEIKYKLLLEPVPKRIKQKHTDPKDWLSRYNSHLATSYLLGTSFSLIIVDESTDEIYQDYAKSFADLLRSLDLITFIAVIKKPQKINQALEDSKSTLSSELQDYADLVLELPYVNTQQWNPRLSLHPSYQKLKALIQITTRDEPSYIHVDMADLRYCLTTRFKNQVTLCYLESSINDLDFNAKLQKCLAEEEYPINNQPSCLFVHFLCGKNATLSWICDNDSASIKHYTRVRYGDFSD
jgi:hypothetical protein